MKKNELRGEIRKEIISLLSGASDNEEMISELFGFGNKDKQKQQPPPLPKDKQKQQPPPLPKDKSKEIISLDILKRVAAYYDLLQTINARSGNANWEDPENEKLLTNFIKHIKALDRELYYTISTWINWAKNI